MKVNYRDMLIQMLIASTLDETVAAGLNVLNHMIHPCAVALVLWDTELQRHVIGDVIVNSRKWLAAAFRREAMKLANAAQRDNPHDPRPVAEGFFYQPLNTPDGKPIGAYIYNIDPAKGQTASAEDFELLARATTRALWTITRIDLADREHVELMAERERLEHLLQAVEQQQMTIDRLLSLERRFSTSLEAKVAEHAQALQEAQTRLIQSEKLAVIGQLAGSLAHEINNPVQAIQSGLGLAISELDSGQTTHVKDDLLVIQTEMERIQAIFKQMFDFNRPAASAYLPLDINAICEGVNILLRKKLQETHVDLVMALQDNLPQTCGDRNQLKQVFINLVLNASEAMPATGGAITIETNYVQSYVTVRVTDNGAGIAPKHLPRLFEPLFTTKPRGLGLGLAISQEIIQRHHGQIMVKSQEGGPTTFTVSLPCQEKCDDGPTKYTYR
jgi:C4-dicarboxylate-specific signal transduction histidine kinase